MAHQEGKKGKSILSFFKRDTLASSNVDTSTPSNMDVFAQSNVDTSSSNPNDIVIEEPPSKSRRVQFDGISLVRDPGLRIPIWKHHANQYEDLRRAYINAGPYQPKLKDYQRSSFGKQYRKFQPSWFVQFPWLEYSPTKDAAFCFPCFIFEKETTTHKEFSSEGFRNWKRVNDGSKCAFLVHVGGPTSVHNNALQAVEDLKNPKQHIDKLINAQSSEEIKKNRLRLTASIEAIRWLVFQACAFRGHDESPDSRNRGNFIEMIKLMARLNIDIGDVVLDKAPKNATYTSPMIQREILHILANKVRNKIRDEVGDGKFCILVDEAKDESNAEQMAIVLRFVDAKGILRERFFEIVKVPDTTSLTLKSGISDVLSRYNLHIQDMRGQGYDGASNMRGAWNGLQALFLKDCPYAYYVHCFAHRLQLALVAAAQDESSIYLFFSKLTCIVNLVSASSKRHTELQSAQAVEIEEMVASGERETGRGANQMGNLSRAGTTRWSSHFDSICSLVDMYGATLTVLKSMSEGGLTRSVRGEADGALIAMGSFEFIFILHLMQKIMGVTNLLSKALQQKSLDILSAMDLVSTTKTLLQTLREDGWDILVMQVQLFCTKYGIDIPEMSASYKAATGRSCQQKEHITVEHHYHIDIFNAVINFQLVELNSRFSEEAVELLILSSALDPKDDFKSFKVDDICSLAEKFYPGDFTKQELYSLRCQLEHYGLDIPRHQKFQNMSTISKLCQRLFEAKKSRDYYLIDRLIRLVLTLPVSTATTERAFSAMKLVKSSLRNKMGEEFLADSMIVYIEREFAENIDSDSIINDFNSLKDRRAQLQ